MDPIEDSVELAMLEGGVSSSFQESSDQGCKSFILYIVKSKTSHINWSMKDHLILTKKIDMDQEDGRFLFPS